MDRSVLAARIQDILKGRSRPAGPSSAPASPGGQPSRVSELDEEAAFAARCAADEAASDACAVLGGEVVEGPGGQCVVVERRHPSCQGHGRDAVERYATAARSAIRALPWFPGAESAAVDLSGLLFFDLETTGLSGGAGTCAFLVGCGFFDEGDFVTRQYFLRGLGEERAMLDAVRGFVEERSAGGAAPCLVTYNGRSFDFPLIEMRYVFHRRRSPFASLPHVDMLFPARRLWRRRTTGAARQEGRADWPRGDALSPDDLRASCALTALEQDILGLHRQDDVPGWEIPARYFAYTRTGDARGLAAVLEHNRLDLLSLAAVAAVILETVTTQESTARDRHDCLALARLLEHLDRISDAERCYERAAAPSFSSSRLPSTSSWEQAASTGSASFSSREQASSAGSAPSSSWGPASAGPVEAGRCDDFVEGEIDRLARAEALRWLAIHRRRGKRFVEAADAWQALLAIPGLEAALRREACEALAIHHEHRAKDLQAAQAFALEALDVAGGGRFLGEVQHRLGRLSRKLGAGPKAEQEQARRLDLLVESPKPRA